MRALIISDDVQSFMQFWESIDDEMRKVYGIDTSDAGIAPEEIAVSQDAGWSAVDYVKWYGEKYDLTPVKKGPYL